MNPRNDIDTFRTASFHARSLFSLIVIVVCLGYTQITHAQPIEPESSAGTLLVHNTSAGVQLSWTSDSLRANTLAVNATNAPRFARLLTFEAHATPAITFDAIDASPLKQPASLPVILQQKQALNEAGDWRPADVFSDTPSLPDSPAVLVREGTLNNKHYIVVGISPVYNHAGVTLFADSFTAQVQGARLIDAIDPASDSDAVDASSIPQPAPFNADTWRIDVAAQGMQRITGVQLAAGGLPMNSIPIDHLHLHRASHELDVEVIDADMNGALSVDDELRFYAIQPGDRWNPTDTYWLTLGPRAGQRMAPQAHAPAGARTHIAWAKGTWQYDSVYDSLLPGPDDDHWFSARLNSANRAIDATLQSALPFAAGNVNITVNGSSTNIASVHLIANGVASERSQLPLQTAQDAASSNWTYGFNLQATAGDTEITVQVNSKGDALALEDVQWQAPVALAFNQKGAAFTGLPGYWTYQLDGLAGGAALYDVTDWQHPQRVTLNDLSQFSAGPAAREYVLAGDGTLFEPAISKRETADLSKPVNARAIYIAPAVLHDALRPLIEHRLANGWRATIIDAQAIYDQWSDGQVSPEAIRNFLRYARATWRIKPHAVILVGDGNYDPLNHTGSASPTLVPPFLANVDRRMGETACESCFVQLDGNDALMDTLPDLLYGRLPVKSAAELTALVNKIIAYETQPEGEWMWRNAFIADNTRQADGSYDSAGDFDAFNRRGIAMQPTGIDISAVFYEPLAGSNQPWYVDDEAVAHAKVLAMLNEGAAVVNYTGHGLTNQWAFTAASAGNPSYLLTTQDAAALSNGARLPLVMSMACLTGSFHLPSAGGNSIDEQMVLAQLGGAIASWSSTGLGILFSYEFLQRGFYKAVWQNPGALTIGALAQASLLDLFQNAPCCDEPLRTQALLGDPLTPLRIKALPARLYFPLMDK